MELKWTVMIDFHFCNTCKISTVVIPCSVSSSCYIIFCITVKDTERGFICLFILKFGGTGQRQFQKISYLKVSHKNKVPIQLSMSVTLMICATTVIEGVRYKLFALFSFFKHFIFIFLKLFFFFLTPIQRNKYVFYSVLGEEDFVLVSALPGEDWVRRKLRVSLGRLGKNLCVR